MRELKRYCFFAGILCLAVFAKFQITGQSLAQTVEYAGADLRKEDWNPVIAEDVNQSHLTVHIDGRTYTNLDHGIYMDQGRNILIPADLVRDAFDCSVHMYEGQRLTVETKDTLLEFVCDADGYSSNGKARKSEQALIRNEDRLYLPFDLLAQELGYSYEWDSGNYALTAQSAKDRTGLAYRYDLRERGRAPKVKDQGPYGTCWAFASLTALEAAMLPEDEVQFSVDHMNQNNSFTSPSKDGGQYTMAMAYLAAWQGPVYEADDPYGDGVSDAALEAVRHVQDMLIIDAKDLDGIKKAVFQYGGVESCIYTTMQSGGGESSYYNSEKYAYCYIGEEKPNHDVVIIGWDDHFPAESFQTEVAGDGAFICQNSWGTDFGEDGVFYVSYYDTNIGMHNLVFTGSEESTNYDNIYQSDLCGWVGQLGYNKESMYGANVFTAQADEDLAAAGFYTTGKDTDYEVFVVPEFTDTQSLDQRMSVASGRFANAGYHTVRFPQAVRINAGQKFAVVVWLSTPNAVRPMAIEYAADALTQEADLTDGEGYISAQGRKWADAEETSKCNLCVKAYTRYAQQ